MLYLNNRNTNYVHKGITHKYSHGNTAHRNEVRHARTQETCNQEHSETNERRRKGMDEFTHLVKLIGPYRLC